jgi:hypothetical protein
MKSKLSSKNAFLSPCNIKSTLLTTTMIGIPKFTCRQPSGSSNSSLKSTSTSSSYSSESESFFSFCYYLICTFGSALRSIIKFPISSSFGSSYVLPVVNYFLLHFFVLSRLKLGCELEKQFLHSFDPLFQLIHSDPMAVLSPT